jgi:DNA polymerase-3 subunit alpha
MAALLTSETGNTAKVVKYINECREMGITVLPPDVNASDWSFTPDGAAIRFGLGAIKNLGPAAAETIRKAREEGGGFRSIYDFCERVDLSSINRRVIENLIRAGAMDLLEAARSQKFSAVESAIEAGQRVWRDRTNGQAGLFGDLLEAGPMERPLPTVPEWPLGEKLAGEKETIGFYVTGHPLDQYQEKICELATHDSSKLEGLDKGAEVALCGVLTGIQRKRNRDQKLWVSMQIEDRSGALEAMVFATNYERLAENRARLKKMTNADGAPLRVVALPMPRPVVLDGQRLPASYANFYIANAAVIVPTFNDPQDRVALGILSELFPDRPVVGIHAVDLVWGLGTLHCLTQQQPAR